MSVEESKAIIRCAVEEGWNVLYQKVDKKEVCYGFQSRICLYGT
jgi:hypothetical protein